MSVRCAPRDAERSRHPHSTPSARHVHAKHAAAMSLLEAPLAQLAAGPSVSLACISMQEPFGPLLRRCRRLSARAARPKSRLDGRGCLRARVAPPFLRRRRSTLHLACILPGPWCLPPWRPCFQHRLAADAGGEDGGVAPLRRTQPHPNPSPNPNPNTVPNPNPLTITLSLTLSLTLTRTRTRTRRTQRSGGPAARRPNWAEVLGRASPNPNRAP